MGFDRYHEPPQELPAATRMFAWIGAWPAEDAEAIDCYRQRSELGQMSELRR
jgi:uncharacterized protein